MAKDANVSGKELHERNLKLALGQIEKEFGKGSIMRLGRLVFGTRTAFAVVAA